MADGERCETCRFWQLDEGDAAKDVGKCRRYPPAVVASAVKMRVKELDNEHLDLNGERMGHYDGYLTTIWDEMENPNNATQPGTNSFDWCGEYRPSGAEIPQ